MSLAFSILLFTAAANAQVADDPVFPEPAMFINFAEFGIAPFGYNRCLTDYGWHVVASTTLSVDEVLDETIRDCRIVRDVEYKATVRDGSRMRKLIEFGADEKGRDLPNEATFRVAIMRLFDRTSSVWSTNIRASFEEFRGSAAYDPDAYMEGYRAEVRAGKLDWTLNDE
ncbi:MAG: hypothetical protein WA908_03800 [Pontixanthobacter sp.]